MQKLRNEGIEECRNAEIKKWRNSEFGIKNVEFRIKNAALSPTSSPTRLTKHLSY
jgi:hypothetical protein